VRWLLCGGSGTELICGNCAGFDHGEELSWKYFERLLEMEFFGILRCAQDDCKGKGKGKGKGKSSKQKQKQISFGNDNQKSKSKSNGNCDYDYEMGWLFTARWRVRVSVAAVVVTQLLTRLDR
jgi:hypothetical protein